METFDKKERILQAALQFFTEYGVRSTSVEQIAKQAKVGKGTLYLYFTDKEALFSEVFQRKWDEMKSGSLATMKRSASFMEKLLHLLSSITEYRAADPFFQKIYAEYLHYQTKEIDRGLKRAQLDAIGLIESMVKEGIASGDIPADLPARMIAFLLVKAYSAFMYEWPKEFPPFDPEELKHLLRVFLTRDGS
jgi:AcrR family transcriptional regulator